MTGSLAPIAVLISGNGSNLQAIIDGCKSGDIAARICCVISNEPDAYGLQRARRENIPTHVLSHTGFANRSQFDAALAGLLGKCDACLIVLAGFMRILGPALIERYENRIINLHPSLLPDFKGLNTHARVLAEGRKEHGATVHFVTADLDEGPIIAQSAIPVTNDDTVESLQERVHRLEHVILPRAISWIVDRRIRIENQQVLLDGKPVPRLNRS